MTKLTLTDCRPEVLAFALLMEAELRANDHKPGWKNDLPLDLAYRAREEANELRDLILDTKSWQLSPEELDAPGRHGLKSIRERIASEAADTANMAMMTADVSGALPLTAAHNHELRIPGDLISPAEARAAMAEEFGKGPPLITSVAEAGSGTEYVVWSNEHRAWWGPDRRGYYTRLAAAGRYSREDALEICTGARGGRQFNHNPSEVPLLLEDAGRFWPDDRPGWERARRAYDTRGDGEAEETA